MIREFNAVYCFTQFRKQLYHENSFQKLLRSTLMARYHLSPRFNGEPRRCTAKKKCKYADENNGQGIEHYNSKAEAMEAYTANMAREHSAVPSTAKKETADRMSSVENSAAPDARNVKALLEDYKYNGQSITGDNLVWEYYIPMQYNGQQFSFVSHGQVFDVQSNAANMGDIRQDMINALDDYNYETYNTMFVNTPEELEELIEVEKAHQHTANEIRKDAGLPVKEYRSFIHTSPAPEPQELPSLHEWPSINIASMHGETHEIIAETKDVAKREQFIAEARHIEEEAKRRLQCVDNFVAEFPDSRDDVIKHKPVAGRPDLSQWSGDELLEFNKTLRSNRGHATHEGTKEELLQESIHVEDEIHRRMKAATKARVRLSQYRLARGESA